MLKWLRLLLWLPLSVLATDPPLYNWNQYKADFITADGRVIDWQQQQISHSEGQGYGMLLAVLHDDPQSFATLWRWTQVNLQIRSDGLFAWAWGESSGGTWQALDHNNATDGDILIAWALLRAGKHWRNADYHQAALRIINTLERKMVFQAGKLWLLLPGEYGFLDAEQVRFNPSYQILPAFREFAHYGDPHLWQRLLRDAQGLIDASMDNPSRLPADWLWLNRESGAIDRLSDWYGYEAIRIVLYPLFEQQPGVATDFISLHPLWRAWQQGDKLHAQYALQQPAQHDGEEIPAGFYLLYSLVAQQQQPQLAAALRQRAAKVHQKQHANRLYYANSLLLFGLALQPVGLPETAKP